MQLRGAPVGAETGAYETPEEAIAIAVVRLAVDDLARPQHRPEALAWLNDGAAAWLGPLDVDQDAFLDAIAGEISGEPGPRPPEEVRVLRIIAGIIRAGERATTPAVDAAMATNGAARPRILKLLEQGLVERVDQRKGVRPTMAGMRALSQWYD